MRWRGADTDDRQWRKYRQCQSQPIRSELSGGQSRLYWLRNRAEGLQWRKSRRRLSQPKRSKLSSGELRLLRLRNRGSEYVAEQGFGSYAPLQYEVPNPDAFGSLPFGFFPGFPHLIFVILTIPCAGVLLRFVSVPHFIILGFSPFILRPILGFGSSTFSIISLPPFPFFIKVCLLFIHPF